MPDFILNSGDHLPALGFGTWLAPRDLLGMAVCHALSSGYRHFDCAPLYLNESVIGNALKLASSQQNIAREKLWVTSKLWNAFHRFEDVRPAVVDSLRDLQLDYLDLLLMHWPVAMHKDANYNPPRAADFIPLADMPLEDTWQAMEELVAEGLVRNIGVANFSIAHLTHLLAHCKIKPAVNQVEHHPYLVQEKLLEYCQQQGIHCTAYSPLGSPGRPDHLKSVNDPILLEDPLLSAISEEKDFSVAQVLIAWSLQSGLSVIPKSVTPARIDENYLAQKISLTPDNISQITDLNCNFRCVTGALLTQAGSPYTQQDLWG